MLAGPVSVVLLGAAIPVKKQSASVSASEERDSLEAHPKMSVSLPGAALLSTDTAHVCKGWLISCVLDTLQCGPAVTQCYAQQSEMHTLAECPVTKACMGLTQRSCR